MTRGRWVYLTAAGVAGAALLGALALAMAWSWPRPVPGPLERGHAAYVRRDWSAAVTLAQEVLKARPGDPEALRLLARAYARLGRDGSADALYKRLGAAPLGAEDYLVIASALHRQGDLRSAFRLLEKGHERDPDHADTLHDLSRFCASMDQMSRAEDLAGRLAKVPGQGVRAGLLLGAIRDTQSDPVGAAEAMETALRLDPVLRDLSPVPAEVRKLLARDYLKVGKPAEARARLKPVLDAGPDPEASWLLSRAWLQEGRTAEAAVALKQARGYGADNPLAFEPAPFVGSDRCADCHRAIHRAEQSSRHARTFLTGPGLARLPLPAGPRADPSDPNEARHTVGRRGETVEWEARVDGEVARAVIQYAFGSGDRGVTPVGRDGEGRFREMRLSHYGDTNDWDVTAGHPARPASPGADGLLGRVLSGDDLRRCLGCHTTDFRASRDHVGPLARETGIGCERCHGPGGNHLKAVAAGLDDLAIARPRLAPAAEVTRLCAECHSPRGRSVEPTDPDAVRFQGTTLAWSRCYQESQEGLSCVTCHDPHRDAETSASFYEAKCLNCHAAGRGAGGSDRGKTPTVRRVSCPVNPASGCLTCHMPVTKSAVPHTAFTDHRIGIHPSTGASR